jgi:hypothetical protein
LKADGLSQRKIAKVLELDNAFSVGMLIWAILPAIHQFTKSAAVASAAGARMGGFSNG